MEDTRIMRPYKQMRYILTHLGGGVGGKGVGMRGRKDSDVLITFRCEIVE